MSPFISLVAGYRNRDLQRVKRFLDSLSAQTFQDFELIMVDYGSDIAISEELSDLCSGYSFCVYLFCDTRGKIWNRAHALNIGIQRAQGKYFLSADVDLIYSKEILTHLSAICNERSQIFCKAFLLPETFTDYTQLSKLPVDFSLSKQSTLGLFHCVQMDWVRKVGGYDEYYRIWGFEDNDFAQRLEATGLKAMYMDEQINPMYHQWHPAGSKHVFMQWWWEDMTLYHETATPEVRQRQSRGELMASVKRPLNVARSSLEFVCPTNMNPFERRKCMSHIMHLSRSNAGTQICVELYKEPDRMYVQKGLRSQSMTTVATAINRSLRFLGSTIHLKVADSELQRSEVSMLYFFYNIIMKSDLLQDYRIEEFSDKYRFSLLFNPY